MLRAVIYHNYLVALSRHLLVDDASYATLQEWGGKIVVRYYEGYEGEGEVKVWSEENGNEDGIVIWIGFFNIILEGCFSSEFQKNGIIECYFNQDGFYDEKWEMKYLFYQYGC